jgi:hypothetical protein
MLLALIDKARLIHVIQTHTHTHTQNMRFSYSFTLRILSLDYELEYRRRLFKTKVTVNIPENYFLNFYRGLNFLLTLQKYFDFVTLSKCWLVACLL